MALRANLAGHAALLGLLGLSGLVGLTALEREAEAAEVKVSARTIGEGYVIVAPDLDTPRLIRRRRLVQYVNLGAYELLPPTEPGPNRDVWVRPPEKGQLEIVASLPETASAPRVPTGNPWIDEIATRIREIETW
mgnify:CR=1 FL=1